MRGTCTVLVQNPRQILSPRTKSMYIDDSADSTLPSLRASEGVIADEVHLLEIEAGKLQQLRPLAITHIDLVQLHECVIEPSCKNIMPVTVKGIKHHLKFKPLPSC